MEPINEAGCDHPPANRALQSAHAKNCPKSQTQTAFDPAFPKEPQERHEENNTDRSPEQPMGPFPPIDHLEFVEAHAAIEFPILRYRLVFFELGRPIRSPEG